MKWCTHAIAPRRRPFSAHRCVLSVHNNETKVILKLHYFLIFYEFNSQGLGLPGFGLSGRGLPVFGLAGLGLAGLGLAGLGLAGLGLDWMEYAWIDIKYFAAF